jgi:uncharacterized membrane protein HdeD (DUF308 family)
VTAGGLLRASLATLGCLLIAAHALRADAPLLAALCAAVPCLFFVRRPWAPRVVQLFLLVATLEWVRTITVLVHDRLEAGAPWRRMAAILAVVAGVTLWAALLVPAGGRERETPGGPT